ncbi:long-chain-fatty-acid--CoA ligase [Alkalihalobacterium sp. APHAB7]|uniref:long-chain-fatty-acid--CoA ligase n=1 Tax=Alkalihalobacterium sp. APHAB7 TaxID=3402081 RepID=UPI003AAEFC8A
MLKSRWLNFYPEGVPETLEIPSISVYQLLERTAIDYPDQLAVIDEKKEWTYETLKKYTDRFAVALHQSGFQKGDKLAVMLPNSAEYIISYYAALRLGGIVVQVNPLYQSSELEYLFENSQARWFVGNDIQRPKINALPNVDIIRPIYVTKEMVFEGEQSFYPMILETNHVDLPEVDIDPKEDVAVLQYTGGTTGRSKGVMLTHYNLIANVHQSFVFSDGFFERPGERILSVTPFFHVYGMTGAMNLTIFGAGTIICMKRFTIEQTLEYMEKYRPTFFPGVPTMYIALLRHPRASKELLSSMKVCNSGSAPMPVEAMKEFEAKTGAAIVEGYGLSEAAPITHRNPVTGLKKAGSIGIPIPNTESKIVDRETGTTELPPGEVGELIIKGPQVMKGYWNNESETMMAIRDKWLYTGDLAKMDEDGYFYIVGRKKDLIIASGYNVYPTEVEDVLYQHPAVSEACVFGVADAYRGETVKAVLVLKDEDLTVTEAEIVDWCSKRLAAYKVPKQITFRKELPKTAVGKILRQNLIAEETALHTKGEIR